jgi:transcriptional regulator with XRE-family HTH domain
MTPLCLPGAAIHWRHAMALTAVQNEQIADRIRETMARRRISRKALAVEARISVSTLEKAMAGDRPFSLASVMRIEQALGIVLRAPAVPTSLNAPPELGSYSRDAVSWLEGHYLTLRPCFEVTGSIHAYCTTIAWDGGRHCLQFSEGERFDSVNAQAGHVSLPALTGKIYLSTSQNGQLRLAILNSPTRSRELAGLLLTLTAGAPSHPVATPIVLVPRRTEHAFGRITREDPAFPAYQALLREARKKVHVHDIPP